MRPTFYLASASSEPTRAAAYMADLVSRGFVNAMDWTVPLSAHESEWADLAVRDVEAAVSCSLFVLVAQPESYGAMLELGARLASGRLAHVVGPPWHFFLRHPHVIRHEDWLSFVADVNAARRPGVAEAST